jgi:hypothetical protein
MRPWSIARQTKNGRVELHFHWGGDLEDFHLLEQFIQQEAGGKIARRIDGPCGTSIRDVSLPDHDITVIFDSGCERIWFYPVKEADLERTQAFADRRQSWMNGRNERAWLSSADAQAMLSFLGAHGKLSERKARLFVCAAVRQVWRLLADERSRRAVETAERYADGQASAAELRFAFSCAADAYAYAASSHTADTAAAAAANAAHGEARYTARRLTPRQEHPALLRCLFRRHAGQCSACSPGGCAGGGRRH